MKRLSRDAKTAAYNEAIDHLRLAQSDGCDTPEEAAEEQRAFLWLAEKLDRECQKLF